MEWDAIGMHCWLLNLAIQEEPPGSLPNDMSVIRRWLRLPPSASGMCQRGPDRRESGPGCNCSDCVWRRVQPQIFTAWKLQGERWFSSGLVETFKRKDNYANRYGGTKSVRERYEKVPKSSKDEIEVKDFVLDSSNSNTRSKPSKSKACRLPEDFIPQPEHYELANSLGINCEIEYQKFRDYYLGIAGQKGLKLDWSATLRNWLRNSVNYHNGGANGSIQQASSKNEQRVKRNREAITEALKRHYGGEDAGSCGTDYGVQGTDAQGEPTVDINVRTVSAGRN